MPIISISRASILAVLVCAFSISAVHAQDKAFAIVGVNVVPMDVERILENQIVVVDDGVIQSVSDTAATTLPDDLPQIDGSGLFLMPGLADLHVHLRNEDELINYLAWGVTTVMHLGGSGQSGRRLLEFRQEIRSGERLGPNIYATERIIDGDPAVATDAHSVKTEDDARRIVRQLKSDDFDFVKIYNNVSTPVFEAIVNEADKQGLAVIGHIPRNIDPLTALGSGQNAIAHTEELFFTYFEGPRSTENMPRDYSPDLDKLPALVDVLRQHNVALMPDLIFTFGNLLMWDSLDHLWGDPEFPYLHPNTASMWRAGNINRRPDIENFILRGQWKYNLLQTLTLEFEKAGLLQVIGTDASLPGLFPGKAAHRELTELVKAGLSNFDSLAIGSKNAGEFVRRYIDQDARFGQVLPDYRADLVLLEENPLDDVRNAKLINAVVVNGRYVEAAVFNERRAALKTRYDALHALNEQVDAAVASDEVESVLQDIVAAHEGDAEARNTMETRINAAGYAAGFAGDLDQAQELLELNTRLFPLSPNTWDSLAEVTLYLGDRERAIELYREALAVDPDFANAREQIAVLSEGSE